MIDLTAISQWCIAITGILVFLKYVSAPIKALLENNKTAMEGLQNAINKLSSDLKDNDYKWAESQAHRNRLQNTQDKHEERIG
ncbi:ATPase, partial [Parasutterella excrementihominis]